MALWLLLVLLALAACRGGSTPGAAPSPATSAGAASCVVAPTPDRVTDSLVITLTDSVVASHAPLPGNDAERLVFAQLYETLVRVDCEGNVIAGLARAWTSSDDGRRWTFALREDAKFWDGAPVTARDVVAGWRARAPGLTATASPDEPLTLTVTLGAPASTPGAFAGPLFAVTKRAPDGTWPIGTGVYWVAGADRDALTVRPVPGRQLPSLLFRSLPGVDARDALDAGADLLVTGDPAVLGYAATRTDLATVALPWDRTYALAVFPASGSAGSTDDLRAALAHLAVRAEARPAEPLGWWRGAQTCAASTDSPSPAAAPPLAPAGRRIAYPRGDLVARDLADRLVALGRYSTSVGLLVPQFSEALAQRREAAFIVAVPRVVLDACGGGTVTPALRGAELVPLVDTRRRAVLRGRPIGSVVEWDGTLRFGIP